MCGSLIKGEELKKAYVPKIEQEIVFEAFQDEII